MKWLLTTLFLLIWTVTANSEVVVTIGDVGFKTDVADTAALRAKGLMFRDGILPDQAMLFIYPQDKQVAFWMKNVSFPIDIIFINACGLIVKIHENAIPENRTPIPSENVIRAVLEIQGGASKRNQMRIGASVKVYLKDQKLFDQCDG